MCRRRNPRQQLHVSAKLAPDLAEAPRDPMQLAKFGNCLVVLGEEGTGRLGVHDLPNGERQLVHPCGLEADVRQEPAARCPNMIQQIFSVINVR